MVSDPGLAHLPRWEAAADDALVHQSGAAGQLAALIEQGEPRRGPAPAWRAIDLAVRKDGHVSVLCGEHHAVDAGKLRFERMDELAVRLDGRLDLSAELDASGAA